MIVGFRLIPDVGGWVAIGLGVVGLAAWAIFLIRLRRAQPREVLLSNAEPVDSEVTGYIASYLLPILAATSPSTGDIIAYALCAALILVVAFAADFGCVNPVVYLMGLRVMRVTLAGEPVTLLAKRVPTGQRTSIVAERLGVMIVLQTGDEDSDDT
jgi:hypothetical protein